MRKLVSVQVISAINPIPDADRIEVASIQGWKVVVQKGLHTVGDKVAYFEIDSLLPETVPAYASFQERGQKVLLEDGKEIRGHVVKTIKLRGVYSQGVLIPLRELGYTPEAIAALSEGDDLTEALEVRKWEAPLPMGNGNIKGNFDTRFAPKTDAIRVQNLAQVWELLKTLEWEPTLKVDGTSQTLANDAGEIRLFGRNWELDTATAAGYTVADQAGLVEELRDHPGMALQFELVGPGVQGNRLKLAKPRPVVFAVWLEGVKLPRSEWPTKALEFATPILGEEWLPTGELDEMLLKVEGLRGNLTRDVLDEGIVYHPVNPGNIPSEVRDLLDRNLNWKIINNKFILKYSE